MHVATGFGINLGAFCNARDLAPIFTEHREREIHGVFIYLPVPLILVQLSN